MINSPYRLLGFRCPRLACSHNANARFSPFMERCRNRAAGPRFLRMFHTCSELFCSRNNWKVIKTFAVLATAITYRFALVKSAQVWDYRFAANASLLSFFRVWISYAHQIFWHRLPRVLL